MSKNAPQTPHEAVLERKAAATGKFDSQAASPPSGSPALPTHADLADMADARQEAITEFEAEANKRLQALMEELNCELIPVLHFQGTRFSAGIEIKWKGPR